MNGLLRQADPPRTLAERLQQLNDNLQSLGGRLKEAIASAVSTAVAQAIHDVVRNLLGPGEVPALDHHYDPRDDRRWDNEEDPRWTDEQDYYPSHHQPPVQNHRAHGPNRWRDALGMAVQTALWWIRQEPRRRTVLTTAAVAVAAGITAFIAGPVFGAGVGVLASAASLLVTANSASTASDHLRSFAEG